MVGYGYPDFKGCKPGCIDFLRNYYKEGEGAKYESMLQEIANRQRTVLPIYLDDVEEHVEKHQDEKLTDFVREIERNTAYFVSLFAEAADSNMPPPTLSEKEMNLDVYDYLIKQRRHAVSLVEKAQEQGGAPATENPTLHKLPPELTRRYQVVIYPRSSRKPLRMRQVDSRNIGGLITVRGIVTQVTDVKPLITVACYLDDESGYEYYQEVKGRSFQPLQQPPPHQTARKKTGMHMEVRGCKFVKYQEIKMQELPDEVPTGETPRTLVVHARGELTRSAKPGDVITVAGVFLPEPYTGFRNRMGLLTSTHLEAMRVDKAKSSYADFEITEEQRNQIMSMAAEGDMYDRLANSIAPEIYGHEDVKKALLLLMVDGVSRQLPDGMKLRGNIHMCLMGDPGVAKSQLLRFLAHVSPRAVYTTGKGSSGVGLTAAVMRDPNTSEMVLEGGALVMADKGICCIDEFDKMDEIDRTAIHEVMEQQTVSIAKAGITTTLNTRCSILAAANPAWGRYDTRRSPSDNIALPAALLSRFDLLWLILDKHNADNDRKLAKHVLEVHSTGRAPSKGDNEGLHLDPSLLRAYIAEAKRVEPTVPPPLGEYIAAVYAEMRAEEAASEQPHSYTTARTLLSILRLGQALARLRFSDVVVQADVDEALRLMRMSKYSLFEDREEAGQREDPISQVYFKIRDDLLRQRNESIVEYSAAQLRALLMPQFSRDIIRQCLEEYASSNIWQLDTEPSGEYKLIFMRGDATRA